MLGLWLQADKAAKCSYLADGQTVCERVLGVDAGPAGAVPVLEGQQGAKEALDLRDEVRGSISTRTSCKSSAAGREASLAQRQCRAGEVRVPPTSNCLPRLLYVTRLPLM